MELLYIRHGHAESNLYNPDGLVGSDLQLTSEGIRQAHITATTLADLAIKGVIGPVNGTIYSSPYLRARQTAEIIAEALNTDITIDYRLKEIQKGDWDGMRVEDVINLEGAVDLSEQHEFRPPNGENWFDVAERMIDFINDIESRGEHTAIIVSHNHPIEIAIGKLTGLDVTEWKDHPVDNASINHLVKSDALWNIDQNLYNVTPWKDGP